VLATAARSFPAGTIHLAVVDPGVGSERRPIIVESNRAQYVGPDNGLLMLSATHDGLKSIYQIQPAKFLRASESPTFHGRDIFAPTAGHLARGTQAADLGRQITDFLNPTFAQVKRIQDSLVSDILHIDDFGNIVTGIDGEEVEKVGLQGSVTVKLGRGRRLKLQLVRAYSDVKKGSFACLIGSHGYLEIAKNRGSAAHSLHARPGQSIAIQPER
jgi:hypothetical protein